MTCIIGIVDNDKVWMGGDAAGTHVDSWLTQTGLETKVWKAGDVVFGGCGSFRIMQLLRYKMIIPTVPDGIDALEYLTGDFVDAMRTALGDGGALTIWDDTSTEEMEESGYLVALQGRVFEIYADFGVGEFDDGFASIGCGKGFALGSLYSTHDLKPKERVQLALEAAEHFSAGVRGPFTILKL